MKKNLILIVLLSLLVSFSCTKQKTDEGQRALVFTHATIINTAGGPNEADMTVVISGKRIMEIKKSKVRLPKGAQVIDATGKFLIPGFWDMHVHWSDARYFPLFIANGITGIRIMWGTPDHLKQREEISKGLLFGPHMYVGSPIVDGPNPIFPGFTSVSNAIEAREFVRQAKETGYDFVKVYSRLPREAYFAIADESKKLGIPFAGHIPMSISAVEASDSGQRSVEHVDSPIAFGTLFTCSNQEEELLKESEKAFKDLSLQQPQPAQIEAFRALSKILLETYDRRKASTLFALFVKNNTWQCPTLTVLRSMRFFNDKDFINDTRLKYMPKRTRASWELKNHPVFNSNSEKDWALGKLVYQKELELVGSMRRAGVKLLAGTDLPNPFCFPGFSLHDELGLLVEAGLTPMEALQAATYNAAEFLGQLDSLGTVEAGKIADLVLLDANPLEDISNTKKIAAVVFAGKYYSRSALNEMLAQIEVIANQAPIAEVMLKTITEKDISSAIQQYHELKATQPDAYDFREQQLNTLGYQLLRMNKIPEAIEIFKLNVEAYPHSSNVYDSLGEAYMVNGDRELAIMNYEKSLELDPTHSNAVETLKKLKGEKSPAQEKPLATKVEHFFVASEKAQALFLFFKETFQLPEVWPFFERSTFASGGLSLGNVVLEFVSFPKADNTPQKTEFRGIAFEPTADAEAIAAELTRRNVPHSDALPYKHQLPGAGVLVERSSINLSDFPPINVNIFFCDYKDRHRVSQGRKAASDELVKRRGGPLGIIGAAEITVGVQDFEEAKSKWSTLLAPLPHISDDAFIFEFGPRIRLVRSESPGIQGIILSVRSLDQAEKFLKERQLLVKDVGQIAIAPERVEGLLIRFVRADQAQEPAHPLIGPGQGTGQGVDHVVIAVRDFKKMKDDYEQVLGFKVRELPPQDNGWPHASIPFENVTYLEFQPIAALPWLTKKFDYADGYADFAEKYEGAVFLGLATSSAKHAADHLKACNFQVYLNVDEAPGLYDLVEISHKPSGEKRAFPLAILLEEYSFDPERPARIAVRREQGMMTHPNTARRLYSVWFAVRDLEVSHRRLQDAGFEPGQEREMKFLGATGREIRAGDGCLLLLQSVDKNGVVSKFLSDRHDGEIIGVSIEVSDLDKARIWIEGHSRRKLEFYNGFYGRSILIPPETAHGVWMELFQQ
ncbi:MAG: amidohydrolase family protein [candidate division KSB1 bacterium]|nr:amidohydrolase family protein [candidate division KSB1 bacterium]